MRIAARCPAVGTVVATLAGLALVSGLAAHSAAAQTVELAGAPAGLSPELEQARAALDKYRDPILAVHDGYFSTLACVEYRKGGEGAMPYMPGGMGVHFINLQNIGPVLDPAKPQVLIYEPRGERLELAAAEWFVPTAVAGGARPSIFGQELQGPMEGHEPLQPNGLHHYDLHVWLWRQNPAGTFSPTNPAVTCPKGSYSFKEHPPKLVDAAGH